MSVAGLLNSSITCMSKILKNTSSRKEEMQGKMKNVPDKDSLGSHDKRCVNRKP